MARGKKPTEPLPIPSREDQQRLYDSMEPFMHCNNCAVLKPPSVSPAEWVQMEAGMIEHGTHLALWCKRCEMVIAIFELKHPITGFKCGCGQQH
jgi:hypothetical protein